MDKQGFIDSISSYIKEYAQKYGISVCSPIIAQACLESAFGTSRKAQYHNYFGLKYRKGRVSCNLGYFADGGSEQNADGSYTQLDPATTWYSFADMASGVEGYFQFINIPNYANLKGVTDPYTYLKLIKQDGYATSIDYVENVYAVVKQYNLTKYDRGDSGMGITIIPNSGFKGYNVSARTLDIKYIVVHYVGSVSDAANNVIYFSGGNRHASADFFVGYNGAIYQYNPDLGKYYSWHCGGGRQTSYGGAFFGKCTNGNSIGIEMCVKRTSSGIWYFEDATVNGTKQLVKYLMSKYGVPVSNVIRHYDVTGKFCPNVPGWIPPTGNEAKWNAFKKSLSTDSGTLSDGSDGVSGEGAKSYTTTFNVLKKGAKGAQVQLLQRLLRMAGKKGADGNPISLDGDFGANTETALKKYQKANGLTVDGICGSATWGKIIGF